MDFIINWKCKTSHKTNYQAMKRTILALLASISAFSVTSGQEVRVRALSAPANEPWQHWTELSPPDKQPIEDCEENRVSPVSIPAWQTRYTLGPGDTLTFSIYDRPDLTRDNVQIAPDGTVSYLQAVAVRAEGLTFDQLRNRIETELSKYQKNVKVIVSPAEIASKSVSIIGRVRKPGSFNLDRPTSVLEAIALAEGIQIGSVRGSAYELADFDHSFVARRGRKLDLDLAKLYYEGDFSQNAYLEPSDYIYIASNLDNEVYILGEVLDPGRRKMPHPLTITQAVAEAGGFAEYAFRMRVLLIRGSIHAPETTVVNMKAILTGAEPDVKLQNKDIVFVSKRPFEMAERVLDSAVVTFMQTVTAEAMNQNYNPVFSGGSTTNNP